MSARHLELAAHFARLLDAEDHERAAACLGAECRYDAGDETHVGPAAVVASYRAHAAWAARHLDHVAYESAVRAGEQGEVVVRFTDHVTHAGVSHTYRCEQALRFDATDRIVAIRHIDLPGERDALQRFFDRVGLAQPRG